MSNMGDMGDMGDRGGNGLGGGGGGLLPFRIDLPFDKEKPQLWRKRADGVWAWEDNAAIDLEVLPPDLTVAWTPRDWSARWFAWAILGEFASQTAWQSITLTPYPVDPNVVKHELQKLFRAAQDERSDAMGEIVAQNQDYDAFFDREMEFRRTMGYPPHDAMVNILFRGPVEDEVAKNARSIARRLKAKLPTGVLGPSPSPLSKVRDEFRYQVVVRGKRGVIRETVHEALIAEFGAMRFPGVSVDVDPLSLM